MTDARDWGEEMAASETGGPVRLSVVIPALNEAERLPRLLDCLAVQTQPPFEVIVADAGSTDETREAAESRGALVVEGGRPAAGRNAGARVASGDVILFIDADVVLAADLLERMLAEHAERGLAVATAHFEPLEREPRNLFACDVANLYLDVMQYVVPHAPGFFILVRRDVHEAIGGFDESLALAEDHDYVCRAAKHGKFRVLRCCTVTTSMRRIEKEGLLRLAFMYLYCEIHVVAGLPVREVPFDYEFGSFAPSERPRLARALAELTERMRAFADGIAALPGDGAERLRALGARELDLEAFDRLLGEVPTLELRQFERYVRARTRLARRRGRGAVAALRATTRALLRGAGMGESADTD